MDKKRLIIYPLLFLATVALATRGFRFFDMDSLIYPYMITIGAFLILFVIAQIIKDNSIVDMFWGMGFVIGAISTLIFTKNPTILSYVVTAFIFIWGMRLSLRLIKRNWGKPEDFRYANWRKEWGDRVVITAFFRVFMVQALINFVVGSASYTVIAFNQFSFDSYLSIFVALGLLISLTGLFFEVVGDEQLRKHILKGEKKLMDKGLWSITRHPNYFGEIMIWIGLYIVGFSLLNSEISMIYYATLIISPILMSLVMIKISTPLLEKHMSKYDGWEAYTKKTAMIFPWGKKG
jgi:steroid 5-alpha reductase family enzyme